MGSHTKYCCSVFLHSKDHFYSFCGLMINKILWIFFFLNNHTYEPIKPDKFKCSTLVDEMRDNVYFVTRTINLANLACDISSNSPCRGSVNSLSAPEGSLTLKAALYVHDLLHLGILSFNVRFDTKP